MTKVITLSFRKDRHEHILQELNRKNLDFELFWGINGYKLSAFDLKYVTYKSKTNLSKGSIGCAISHIKLWEEISKLDPSNICLIFEDDVMLSNDFIEKLYNLFKQLPSDFDFIYLGSGNTRGRDIKYWVGEQLFRSYNPRRGLYAYIVNPTSVIKLIKLVKPFDLLYGGIDTKIGNLTRQNKLVVYHYYPSIVNVNYELISNIYNFSLRKKKKVMKPISDYKL